MAACSFSSIDADTDSRWWAVGLLSSKPFELKYLMLKRSFNGTIYLRSIK